MTQKARKRVFGRGYFIPFIALPALAGAFTGCVVFFFRLAASFVMKWAEDIFAYARTHHAFIPLLLLGVLSVAVLSVLLTNYSVMSRGGGIPTAIAALRGLLTFRWLRTLLCVFFSSLLTFFARLPLGNEGPSVQMGTSVGRGVSLLGGKKYRAAERYVMTGGACAGFAAATGAPISGIFFALEDAHRRFTPTIILAAASGVLSGVGVCSLLGYLIPLPTQRFALPQLPVIPFRMVWAVALIGVAAALVNILVLWLYRALQKLWERTNVMHRTTRIVALFLLTAAVGLALPGVLGTGHDLTDSILSGDVSWYLLLALLALRALFTLSASVSGVTGGLFLPLIAFGALGGGLCAKALIAAGAVGAEYYGILTVIGIAAFLGASLKTPVTAVIFSLELFGALYNSPYLILGVTVAFLLTELFGHESINDTVMYHKIQSAGKRGKKLIVDVKLTVRPGAFVIGKETRDILWPAACRILTIRSAPGLPPSRCIREGDMLHVNFETRDFAATAEELCALLGAQDIPLRYAEDMADEPYVPGSREEKQT